MLRGKNRLSQQGEVLDKISELLNQLKWHHLSQGKNNSPTVTKAYNRELANKCNEVLRDIKNTFIT